MKTKISWALSLFVAIILGQSLVFKFSGSTETAIIFFTIADWMASVGVPELAASTFGSYGGFAVGAIELIAVALIIIPKTRILGALITLAVISSAIFFHLFTPLGVDRVIDAAGNTDGGALFYTALAVWVSSVSILLLASRRKYSDKVESVQLAAA